ncbi:hypothetical protein KQ945_13915 [Bacillus subtilis subsp. subtilis]|nr:hypothetical protein [Bacillus subtilis subsp. subtilis]
MLALPAFAWATAGATAPEAPTLQQAQAAMDHLFDQAIADRPASDSSRLVADAFRPRLQALSSCLPVAAATVSTVDCIATAQAGPEAVHRLLRFSVVHDQWTLDYAQRSIPVPVPPTARVQVLLRATFSARLARETDPVLRADIAQAARTAEVFGVEDCEVGDDAPVIECTVSAGAGGERGQQTMTFTWEDGQWQNAAPP